MYIYIYRIFADVAVAIFYYFTGVSKCHDSNIFILFVWKVSADRKQQNPFKNMKKFHFDDLKIFHFFLIPKNLWLYVNVYVCVCLCNTLPVWVYILFHSRAFFCRALTESLDKNIMATLCFATYSIFIANIKWREKKQFVGKLCKSFAIHTWKNLKWTFVP